MRPEVVLDVERRGGAVLLVLANTGSATAFEPRVEFTESLFGLGGQLVVSDLPVWSRLALLRPGRSVEVLLDAQVAMQSRHDTALNVTVVYIDSNGTRYGHVIHHDLTVHTGLPQLHNE